MWAAGPTGIGYGDNDDATELEDMQFIQDQQVGYASVYLRKSFNEPNPAAITSLWLKVDYDDGFVAYLNGQEVARRFLNGTPPLHTALTTGSGHEAGTPEEIDITSKKGFLVAGTNVLAIQVHNNTMGSGDLSMIPELLDRQPLGGPPVMVIRNIDALQNLAHVRGIYSRKQLQAVMSEFWDNHFTTNRDKVFEYLNALSDSDASDAMSDAQANLEASQAEYLESQFFYDNALGNFGDLLLYSATSPTMNIYLDNVINIAAAPNENYAREILELFGFGVDNRYDQDDIVELAKCFTGWTVRKVAREEALPFPQSALAPLPPPPPPNDTQVLGLGIGWKYFKGVAEPTPDGTGAPTTAWTLLDFDDSGAEWINGSTGIGYGDGDDATTLADMQQRTTPAQPGYLTVYMRRKFNVVDPTAYKSLILEARYDDGFVAYLNGHEVARSASMRQYGTPPTFQRTSRGHEVSEGTDYFNLDRYRMFLTPGINVLAIQLHNSSRDSSDASMLPRLLDREVPPGLIENSDPNGVWTFLFDPSKHNTGAKTLFASQPAYRINIPAGRTGMNGLKDALDVILGPAGFPNLGIVNHPSTAEFICIKLIQKFVSDDITLANFKAGTAPVALRSLLLDAISAWNETTPRGNIGHVLERILDPENRSSLFWSTDNFRTKVKTPVEFLNSSVRALDGSLGTSNILPATNLMLGMNLFRREEPDGYPEVGVKWVDTASVYGRITFGQTLAGNLDAQLTWNTIPYLQARGLNTTPDTAQKIVDYFGDLLFQGSLPASRKAQLLEFLNTNDAGVAVALNPAGADFKKRVEDFVALLLSLPEWNFQ